MAISVRKLKDLYKIIRPIDRFDNINSQDVIDDRKIRSFTV